MVPHSRKPSKRDQIDAGRFEERARRQGVEISSLEGALSNERQKSARLEAEVQGLREQVVLLKEILKGPTDGNNK